MVNLHEVAASFVVSITISLTSFITSDFIRRICHWHRSSAMVNQHQVAASFVVSITISLTSFIRSEHQHQISALFVVSSNTIVHHTSTSMANLSSAMMPQLNSHNFEHGFYNIRLSFDSLLSPSIPLLFALDPHSFGYSLSFLAFIHYIWKPTHRTKTKSIRNIQNSNETHYIIKSLN